MALLTTNWKKALKYCSVFSILLILSACSHYRWGNPGLNSLPFQTLYVKPVINKTFIPQAQALISQHLIRCLQQSGICITSSEESADATLIVVLRDYDQTILTKQQKTSTTLASSFKVSLLADCTLLNNITCKPCFSNQCISASINAEVNNNVQQVIYQDMPILAEKLANQIRNLVVGTW